MDKQVIRPEIIHSDYIAMKDDKGNCLTYEELYQRAQLLKDTLEERSLSFILCDFAMETAELIYEVLSSNRVPLLLSADINPVFLDKLADKYMPQYIWCKKEHPYTKKEYIVVKERESHVILKMTDKRIKIHPDVALLLSTSGSTGSAKLVKLSYENLYNNAEYACKHCEINATRKAITNLPLNYTFGLCFCLWHWNCGAAVLFSQHSILSKQYSVFFEQEKVTDFAAVPYTYQMLDKINFWNDSKKKYLNMVMVGGAKITNELLEKMVLKLGDKFWIGYGQTECTCIVSGTNFINKHIKYGTIGKAFENMHISLDKETNELIIKSKSVCMGYAYEGKQLADGNVNGFVLQTGDVAEIDEEGYIYLKGRLSRYIKILGKRISLDEVENILKNNFENDEIVCSGADNQLLVCYVSKIERTESFEEQLVSFLNTSLDIPQRFVACKCLECIPRNETGKILYAKLGEI